MIVTNNPVMMLENRYQIDIRVSLYMKCQGIEIQFIHLAFV